MTLKITTDRLQLIASTNELAHAEIKDREQFARLLGAIVPGDWPPPLNDADSMQFNADRLRETPENVGWWCWYFLKPDPATQEMALVGNGGFKGPPSADGTVEIGYSLFENHQGMGYGTEAVSALVGWAFDHPQVSRVLAHTLPELKASIHLLEKIGFVFVGAGAEEGTIRFELQRHQWIHSTATMTATSQNPKDSAIDRAVEVFLQGFSFTRSRTHPYLVERVESMSVLRDAPRKRGDYRSEEWVAHDVAPEDMDRIARENTRGRFSICAISGINEPQEPLREKFKMLGYRLVRTEPLMVHELSHGFSFESPAAIERVTTAELAESLARATRSRPIQPEYFAPDSLLRQYVAFIDGEVVGWVSSIVVGDATWCSNMYVSPAFRRRGIARSLLARMLHDDRNGGARMAVLLASHTGAKLYPVVGYEQIGTLFLFTLMKR